MIRFLFVFIAFILGTFNLNAADISALIGGVQLDNQIKVPEPQPQIDFSKSLLKSRDDNEFIILNNGIDYVLPFKNISNYTDISSGAYNLAIIYSMLRPSDRLPVSLSFVSNWKIVSDFGRPKRLEGQVNMNIDINAVYNLLKIYNPPEAEKLIKNPNLNPEQMRKQYTQMNFIVIGHKMNIDNLNDDLAKNLSYDERVAKINEVIQATDNMRSQISFILPVVNYLISNGATDLAEEPKRFDALLAWARAETDKYEKMLNTYPIRAHFDGVIEDFKMEGDVFVFSLNNVIVTNKGTKIAAPNRFMFKMPPQSLNNVVYIPNPDPAQPRIESTFGEFINTLNELARTAGKNFIGQAMKIICQSSTGCIYDPSTKLVSGNLYYTGLFDDDIKQAIIAKRNQAQIEANEAKKEAEAKKNEADAAAKVAAEQQAQVAADEAKRVADVAQNVADTKAQAATEGHVVYKNILEIRTALEGANGSQQTMETIFDDVLYCFEQKILRNLQMENNVFDLSNLGLSAIPQSFPKVFEESEAVGLNISGNRRLSLQGLEKIPSGKLRGLDITDNRDIASLAPVAGHALVFLLANNTKVGTDKEGMTNFMSGPSSETLTELRLDNTGITDLLFVGNLRNLVTLSVNNNPLTSYAMKPSVTLKELYIKRMQRGPKIDPRSERYLAPLKRNGVKIVMN